MDLKSQSPLVFEVWGLVLTLLFIARNYKTCQYARNVPGALERNNNGVMIHKSEYWPTSSTGHHFHWVIDMTPAAPKVLAPFEGLRSSRVEKPEFNRWLPILAKIQEDISFKISKKKNKKKKFAHKWTNKQVRVSVLADKTVCLWPLLTLIFHLNRCVEMQGHPSCTWNPALATSLPTAQ